MRGIIRGALAAIAIVAQPALAAPCWTSATIEPAKLRQLDVMLMVGSLRCRTGADDYRADYDRFLARHRTMLGRANQAILGVLRQRAGLIGALEALDEASVGMANRYGERGTFGCADLRAVTAALADSDGAELPHAAEVLVGADVRADACAAQVATLQR